MVIMKMMMMMMTINTKMIPMAMMMMMTISTSAMWSGVQCAWETTKAFVLFGNICSIFAFVLPLHRLLGLIGKVLGLTCASMMLMILMVMIKITIVKMEMLMPIMMDAEAGLRRCLGIFEVEVALWWFKVENELCYDDMRHKRVALWWFEA